MISHTVSDVNCQSYCDNNLKPGSGWYTLMHLRFFFVCTTCYLLNISFVLSRGFNFLPERLQTEPKRPRHARWCHETASLLNTITEAAEAEHVPHWSKKVNRFSDIVNSGTKSWWNGEGLKERVKEEEGGKTDEGCNDVWGNICVPDMVSLTWKAHWPLRAMSISMDQWERAYSTISYNKIVFVVMSMNLRCRAC